MKRRIFRFASILSLIFCIASIALWMRSHYKAGFVDFLWWNEHESMDKSVGTEMYWGSGGGQVVMATTIGHGQENLWYAQTYGSRKFRFMYGEKPLRSRYGVYAGDPKYLLVRLGFGCFLPSRTGWILAFPIWAATAVSSVLPALFFTSVWKRRSLRQSGHCPRCGYDLRATPDRCPECGSVSAKTSLN